MSSASSSPLSSALSSAQSDIEEPLSPIPQLDGPSTPAKAVDEVEESPEPDTKRSPSPPHEPVLADNPDIAFLVMFRSRFTDAFHSKFVHLGPQDIERGVVDPTPSPQVENLLCALLGLVLNRKKQVERGHHGRALEEALTVNRNQWPRSWDGVSPIKGENSFTSMTPAERLTLMRTLAVWALSASDVIQAKLKESYKQARHEDDLNQPLSVQTWGRDGEKRRYWLIEGQDDTAFRLYRESDPRKKDSEWRSLAGSIDELKIVAEKLGGQESQYARKLSQRITSAIPRFEATEEKRKRREYRQMRKAQFSRPEPGFSLYEGRTRGKRMRYTFDDDDDDFLSSDDFEVRRSTRQSGRSTPAEQLGPTVTASGRQVKPRHMGTYGESALSGMARAEDEAGAEADSEGSHDGNEGDDSRATRASRRGAPRNGWANNEVDEMDDEDDAASSGGWDGGDDDEGDDNIYADDVDEEMSDDEDDDEDPTPRSLIVKLPVRKAIPSAHPSPPQPKKQIELDSPIPSSPKRESSPPPHMNGIEPQSSSPATASEQQGMSSFTSMSAGGPVSKEQEPQLESQKTSQTHSPNMNGLPAKAPLEGLETISIITNGVPSSHSHTIPNKQIPKDIVMSDYPTPEVSAANEASLSSKTDASHAVNGGLSKEQRSIQSYFTQA